MSKIWNIGSFQILHSSDCCGCHVGLAGCSMMAIAPVRISANSIWIVLYRSLEPVIVCSCCLLVNCGSPCGYWELLSLGGPCIVLPSMVYGCPRETDQVSQGGDIIAACIRPKLM